MSDVLSRVSGQSSSVESAPSVSSSSSPVVIESPSAQRHYDGDDTEMDEDIYASEDYEDYEEYDDWDTYDGEEYYIYDESDEDWRRTYWVIRLVVLSMAYGIYLLFFKD